jgi:hypothetical protein
MKSVLSHYAGFAFNKSAQVVDGIKVVGHDLLILHPDAIALLNPRDEFNNACGVDYSLLEE